MIGVDGRPDDALNYPRTRALETGDMLPPPALGGMFYLLPEGEVAHLDSYKTTSYALAGQSFRHYNNATAHLRKSS